MSIHPTILRGTGAALLSLSILVSPLADAAVVSGEASISGEFVPKTTFIDGSSPVAISESSTVSGAPTGTVLGQVKVNGTDGGFFSLGSFGQKAFDHESKFSFSDMIVNTGAQAATFTMNFLISAGALETIAREIPPRSGSDANLQAGYEIVISSGGGALFTSAATLSMTGNFPDSFDTNASVNTSGTDLGGVLTHPQTGAPDSYLYAWDDFMGSVDLGILAPGESALVSYDARTFVIAGVDKCSNSDCAARSSIGDPFDVYGDIANDAQSSIGGAGTIVSAPVPVSPIPEPETYAMMLAGLGFLGWVGRRKRLKNAAAAA